VPTAIDTKLAQLKETRNGRRLLSLDRSIPLSNILIIDLKLKMAAVFEGSHDLGLQESPQFCDYFDMIGGVGTRN
jgi:hypothetical protein